MTFYLFCLVISGGNGSPARSACSTAGTELTLIVDRGGTELAPAERAAKSVELVEIVDRGGMELAPMTLSSTRGVRFLFF
jgi:hypothetical protein